MRIGFDAKRAFNNTSGLGNYSRFVISSLATLFPQHRYQLFTPRISERFRSFYPQNGSVSVVEPQGLSSLAPALWRSFGLTRSLKQQGTQIYHGLSHELPAGITQSGVKTVVTIHDLIFLRFPELYKPLDRLIYKRKFASACRRADKIVAISQQTKADIVQFFGTDPSRIEVIPPDIDPVFYQQIPAVFLEEVKQKYRLPAKFLLTVGTLERRKNQLHLLKAWHRSGSELELVFVGRTTAYAQQLHQYIAQHNLEEQVHFLPYVPFQELPAIYRLATVFAYPSIFEGLGLPILEALNCEVPVITSTGSCFAEAGGDAARYVAPDDEQALATAILEVSQNETLQAEMKAKGLQHVLNFRPEKTITQLHDLYKSLLGE